MTVLRRMALFIAVFAAAVPTPTAGRAETPASALSAAQQDEVRELIRTFLLEKPEIIIEAVQLYQTKQEAQAQEEARAALVANRTHLETDPATPIAGNPNGNVTIVEFFDYNCGYCKKMIPDIQELLKTDDNIRYVFKDVPILRPESRTAAKASLAAWKLAPDKYFDFHVALMGSRGEMKEERLLKTAESVGINPDKLKSAMADPEIDKIINRNLNLMQMLRLNGTPAFIIGDEVLPGAVDLATLREIVARKRAS